MSKINLKEFLTENCTEHGCYTAIKINSDGKDAQIDFVYFSKYNFGDGDWFLESPCQLIKVMEVTDDIDTFCMNYVNKYLCLENEEDKLSYINEFVKPMIIDGWLYEIDAPQVAPYLPEEICDIQIISEHQCAVMMLQHEKRKI